MLSAAIVNESFADDCELNALSCTRRSAAFSRPDQCARSRRAVSLCRPEQACHALGACASLALVEPLPRQAPNRFDIPSYTHQRVIDTPLRPAIQVHVARLNSVIAMRVLDGLALRSPKAWRLSSGGSPSWEWPSLRCIVFPSMRLWRPRNRTPAPRTMSLLKWSSESSYQIQQHLKSRDHCISEDTIQRQLRKLDYSFQANIKGKGGLPMLSAADNFAISTRRPSACRQRARR